MANARITRPLTASSAYGRQLRDATAPEALRQLEEVCAVAVQKFDEIVGSEFVNDRSPDRRKTGRHLLGSSNCRVIGTTFPFILSMGSTTEGKKLGALESGSPAHTIEGPVAFDVASRVRGSAPVAKRPAAARFQAAYSRRGGKASASVVVQRVNHPGNTGHHMRERALEAAVRQVYRQTVVPRFAD